MYALLVRLQVDLVNSPTFDGNFNDELNVELTTSLERIINSGATKGLLEQLCIIPGQNVWHLYLDALVIPPPWKP